MRAQTPADWWYFGNQAGIHFTPSGPVADLNGQLTTLEGVATISNSAGDLQFYSDGSTVWDANHQVMPNGTGLGGNSSSTQSAIIIKRPGSQTDYYLFTVKNNVGPEGLRYSRIDMTLNGGNGDVVVSEKDVPLVTSTAEKIAAIPKNNGFWVITLKLPGDTCYAYEVTAAGVNPNPVLSNAGFTLGTGNFLGYLKPNLTGDKVAAIHYQVPGVFLYDFDATTGEMSNAMQLTTSIVSGYGVEFSPSGQYLYAQGYTSAGCVQYDITLGSAAAISASEVTVGSLGQGGGALQLGPDGMIYSARWNQSFLSRINEPDLAGAACDWQDTAVSLAGRLSQIGLPTFLQDIFNISFETEDHCFGEEIVFNIDTAGIDSIFWDFGDTVGGVSDTSYAFFPAHTYSDTGSYKVTLIAKSDTNIDTAISFLFVYPRQSLDLGPDLSLCFPDSVVLDASEPYSTFIWQDSSTADTFLVSNSMVAYVTLFGVCDTLSDTVVVQFDTAAIPDLGPDTSFCEGPSYLLDPGITVGADITWNTNATTDQIVVSKSGTYIVEASNGCGTYSDTVVVEIIPFPGVDSTLLPNDTINCFDTPIILERPDNDSITFFWPDSTSGRRYEVDTTEVVWLVAFNECGFSSDTMSIVFNGEIQTELGEDTIICDEDSIQLFGTDSLATYLWNTGDTTDSIWTIPGITENYIVTIRLRDCEKVESRRVIPDVLFCPSIDCDIEASNVFTPNGDGINDLFRITSDCEIYSYDLYIYNRWGQLVHVSRNSNFGWDGTINGEPATEGIYYYTVEYKDPVVVDADRRVTQGSLTLMRD